MSTHKGQRVKTTIRLPTELHKDLIWLADAEGDTLNDWIIAALTYRIKIIKLREQR